MKQQNIRILKVLLILSLMIIVFSQGVVGDRYDSYREYMDAVAADDDAADDDYTDALDNWREMLVDYKEVFRAYLDVFYDNLNDNGDNYDDAAALADAAAFAAANHLGHEDIIEGWGEVEVAKAAAAADTDTLKNAYDNSRVYDFILSQHTWAYMFTAEWMDCYGSDSDFCMLMRQLRGGAEGLISGICQHNYDKEGIANTAGSGFGGLGDAHIEGENINYYWMNETNTSQTTNETIYKISLGVENRGLLEDTSDILEFRVWGYGVDYKHRINLFSEIEPPDDEELWNYVYLNNTESYYRQGESMILIEGDLLDEGKELEYVCLEFKNHKETSNNFRVNLEDGKNNNGKKDSICNKIVSYDESQYSLDIPWLFSGDSSSGSEPEGGYGENPY